MCLDETHETCQPKGQAVITTLYLHAPCQARPVGLALLASTLHAALEIDGEQGLNAECSKLASSMIRIVPGAPDGAEKVLLAPESLDRGVLQQKPLRGLFERANSGDAAPDHVLQVLLLVELWQRQQE